MFRFLKRFGKASQDAQEPDPYHPVLRFTNAGSLLSHHRAHLQAAFIFAQLGWFEPSHAPGWAALASELVCVSGDRADLTLLEVALACAKRALAEQPSEPLVLELLQGASEHTPLSAAAIDACRPFRADPREMIIAAGFTPVSLTEAVAAMDSWEQRLQIVMWLGDLVQPEYLGLLIHAAEHDPHRDVRMGALKRLPHYTPQPEVRACLERIVAAGGWRDVEPYLSMALRSIREPWSVELFEQIGAK